MPKSVDAKTLKSWLSEPTEIALLDVQEPGPYADGHLFFSAPLPYSRFEIDIEQLVPNKQVRLVLVDGGDGVAAKAAKHAEAIGYANVHVLDGGTGGWKAAGFTLFDGVNLPSKTFGELVEHERHTPRITADDLMAMKKQGENFVIVDGRTWAEYRRFNIPGGISCPNAELPLRIDAIAPDPSTTVVVNCAGRTRSIIGAQTLIDFGLPNKVVALENGTQGWFLAGYENETGADRRYPQVDLDADTLARKQAQARAHADRHGVAYVDAGTVLSWLDDGSRTTYLLDVRTEEEFTGGHIPGFVHAPGGQLQQATDQWVGVKGARIVLVDGELVRAPMVAAWLRQLGHDASVLADGLQAADAFRQSGVAARRQPTAIAALAMPRSVTVAHVDNAVRLGGATVIDLRASADYRSGHIPGSQWSIRPRLLEGLDISKPVILVASDMNTAALAARDLAEAGCKDVSVLENGIRSWVHASKSLAMSPDTPPDSERIDFVFHTYQRHDGNAEAARAYLSWETNLINLLDEQERGVFRISGAAAI